jgi:hypothetical protein
LDHEEILRAEVNHYVNLDPCRPILIDPDNLGSFFIEYFKTIKDFTMEEHIFLDG